MKKFIFVRTVGRALTQHKKKWAKKLKQVVDSLDRQHTFLPCAFCDAALTNLSFSVRSVRVWVGSIVCVCVIWRADIPLPNQESTKEVNGD